MASAPEFAKKTLDPGGAFSRASSRSARATCGTDAKKLEMWPSVDSCAVTAPTSVGWAWPSAFVAMPMNRIVAVSVR